MYFNFHYLPLWQAVKLPILLYKPRFLELKGTVRIESDNIRTGMIRLGFPTVSLYPNTGIMIENHGGEIIFKGRAGIGNASRISIGAKSKVEFGDCFQATALKLASYCGMKFASRVRFGWDCTVVDTDFHKLPKVNGGGVFERLCPCLHRFRHMDRHGHFDIERYGLA